jgi:phosphohistidine phosphatase
MRVLYLLRHAHADPTAPGGTDHDRALAEAGRRGTAPVAARLALGPLPPTLLLCSSARRAVETLELVRSGAPRGHVVEIDRGLYLADDGEMLARVQAVDPTHGGVLVVGHNPGIGSLARSLAASVRDGGDARLTGGFAAGTLAVLGFDAADWSDVAPGRGELLDLTTPGAPAATR